MRRRFGRVLALILAMSLVMANVCAASATDSQAGMTDPVVQESTSEDIQTEETEVLPEDVETEETTGDLQPIENKEESEPAAEEQPAVTEENAAQEEAVPETVKELRFENEDVTVVVSEKEAGAISEGTSLKVVPITANDDATKAQYQEVEKQIQEKAGKEEKEVAGFLAYDITLVDAQGNEVEPNSSVKVSMEYKKETIPEGLSEEKAKEADVTVYHLEEDENGKVKDVVDMGEAKQVENISATDKNEVKKLEMVTESFSTFTIVWNYSGSSNLKVTAHYGYNDEDGRWQEIPKGEIPNFPTQITINRAEEEIDLTSYEREISGYTFENIKVDNPKTGKNVSKLKSTSKKEGWLVPITTYYIQYVEAGDTEPQDWLSSSRKKTGDIYFVYSKKQNGLTINIKTIIENGAMTAEYNSDDSIRVESYKWFESTEENGEYTEVKKISYANGKTNVDGDKLYPAYNQGQDKNLRKWYKVEATLSNGEKVTSEPKQVPYYGQLQNGSFEIPDRKRNKGIPNQFSNQKMKEYNGVWQTTGVGSGDKRGLDIELLNSEIDDLKGIFSWEGQQGAGNGAKDGLQFVELNCEAAGALYQDVLTIEGSSLNYWLSHRARGTERGTTEHDTMYLVMMPAKDAQNLKTQEELNSYLKRLGLNSIGNRYTREGIEQLYDKDGVRVVRVTSDDKNWHSLEEILNTYVPTASVTRFFFMAGTTAANNDTIGNFLDAVGFSQELPPVNEDEFTLKLEKRIEGLDSSLTQKMKNQISFEITAEKKDGNKLTGTELQSLLGVKEGTTGIAVKDNALVISGSIMTLDLSGKQMSYAFAKKKIGKDESYKVTVEEKNAEIPSYDLTTTTQTEVAFGDKTTTSDTATVDNLRGQTTATVTYTNQYKRAQTKTVHFTKVWDDANNKFFTRPEKLEVTLNGTIVVEEDGKIVEKTIVTEKGSLDVASEWKTSWKVPVYADWKGQQVPITYKVTEGDIDSEYVYEKLNNGVALRGDGSEYQKHDFGNVESFDSSETAKNEVSAKRRLLKAIASKTNTELGEPGHRKYIEYNQNTAEYTLNLDVTGKKGETAGVDVLFVIDTSGSMEDGYLSTVKNLLTNNQNDVIDQIFKAEGNVNAVSCIGFAGVEETTVSQWYTATQKESLKTWIKRLRATGGTNWTYAMEKAEDQFEKRNSDNEKVVIFLSDGNPTYSMKDSESWWGTQHVQYGSGSQTREKYYTEAIQTVTGSSVLKNTPIYSVYLNTDTEMGMKKFSDGVASGGGKSELVNGTKLSEALTGILNKVIPTYKNVVITDTLSEYVEFAEGEHPTVTVTKKLANGRQEILPSSEYQVKVDGKKVQVSLLNGKSLEHGVTYTIQFKVAPSQLANDYFAEHGKYPNVGESGTGSTSAGKEGFYSNRDANVTYTVDGKPGENSAEYQKPVVQVTNHKLTYEKKWEKPADVQEATEDIKLHVFYTDGTAKDIVLTKENGYKAEELVPVTKRISRVVEETVEGYTPSYSINENGTQVVVTNSYSKIVSNSIKVVKVWEGNGPKTPIRVSLWQQEGEKAPVQYGEFITLDEGNNWEYVWNDLPLSEGQGENEIRYSYAVREENIPDNYMSGIKTEQKDGMTVVTITNTYDENCKDENFYIANVLQTEKLELRKEWIDNNNAQKKRPDMLEVTVNGKNFTLEKDTWSKELTVAKKKNPTYTATEVSPENYEQQGAPLINTTPRGTSIEFVNKIKTTSITVQKKWNDGDISDRPTSIKFKLLYQTNDGAEWNVYRECALTEENNVDGLSWKVKIDNLPIDYNYKVEEIDYSSEEEESSGVADGYVPSVVEEADNQFVITNTLKWTVKKTDEEGNGLQGAEFELRKGDELIARGESKEEGLIAWTAADGQNLNQLDGEFLISETKAPDGYQLSSKRWSLVFANGLLTTFEKEAVKGDAEKGVVVTVGNEKIYTLPESGGTGIYLYTIGGVLLLTVAGMLIIYKNRRKEVLGS